MSVAVAEKVVTRATAAKTAVAKATPKPPATAKPDPAPGKPPARPGSGQPEPTPRGSSSTPRSRPKLPSVPRPVLRATRSRRLLTAEFLACAAILFLTMVSPKHAKDSPADWLRRASALALLFLVLGLISTGGPRTNRLAAGLGGLVTLGMAIQERDLFTTLAARLGGPAASGVAEIGGTSVQDFVPSPTAQGPAGTGPGTTSGTTATKDPTLQQPRPGLPVPQ